MIDVKVLVARIRAAQSRRHPDKGDESLIFNVFNTVADIERSTTGLNGQFVHWQLLIHCLLHMRSIPSDKDELISSAKKQYQDDSNQLAIVREFEENYSPDRCLQWYTRESFLYWQLNKALRSRDIDSLYIFRFLTRDIHHQLEKYQYASPIRIYRGQLMSSEELQALKDSIGQLISMNSFISTSADRRLALSFLYSSTKSDTVERVLFEIDANPHLDGIKPFADISSLSYFPAESEILLMLGSIFRLVKIDSTEKGISIIQLTLCSNSDPSLQAVLDHMKNEYGHGETTTLSFGMVLGEMGKLDEAERYFRRLLNELSPDHADIAACYHNLGDVLARKGEYQSSIQCHRQSLETMFQTMDSNDPQIGTCFNSIATVQVAMGSYTQALESFSKAFEIWKRAFGEDHPNVALCLSNMAGIYQMHEKYSEALDYLQKALAIRQNHLPADHPQIADTHNNIGLLNSSLDRPDLALEHYKLSMKIKQKSLPPQHPDIAMTLTNLSLLYEEKGDFQQALSYLEQSASIFHQTLHPTHPTILHVERLIQRVSSKLK